MKKNRLSNKAFNLILKKIGLYQDEVSMESGYYITKTVESCSGNESCDYLRDEDGNSLIFDTREDAVNYLSSDAIKESDGMYTITTESSLITYRIVRIN